MNSILEIAESKQDFKALNKQWILQWKKTHYENLLIEHRHDNRLHIQAEIHILGNWCVKMIGEKNKTR